MNIFMDIEKAFAATLNYHVVTPNEVHSFHHKEEADIDFNDAASFCEEETVFLYTTEELGALLIKG